MKAILIDPYAKSVTQVDYDGSLEQAYALTQCDMIEQAHLSNGDVLLVDEEGIYRQTKAFITPLYYQPLHGRALMVKDHTEWKGEPAMTVEEVKQLIRFER